MAKLNDDDIRTIIKRASILQKYHDQAPGAPSQSAYAEDDPVFEIADSLNIKRHFVREALLELQGTDTDEPIFIETDSYHKVELQASARGNIDGSLLSELKSQLEYHFNTVGTISRRKGNVYWKASPAFPAKLFEITSSPEVEFSERNGRVKINLKQSLKTINKWYAPAVAASLGAFMMLAAAIYGVAGNDEAPFIVMSAIFLTGSFFYARFIKSRKKKRKNKLKELVETMQHIMQRRFRAGRYKEETKPDIDLEDFQELVENDETELKSSTRLKN
jgi:hypothetical protein